MKRIQRASAAFGVAALAIALPTGTVELTLAADTVKLTGCLIRGEGDGAGYLLVNSPAELASAPAPSQTAPGAVGTTGAFTNIFYWLTNDDDLRPHIGHRVEIEGEQAGDVKDGEIEIDRKDQWTEIEIKSDGREMKAQVPNASVVPGPDPDRKVNVLVKRVNVENVKMLDVTCR
jgi:hypothetical protein